MGNLVYKYRTAAGSTITVSGNHGSFIDIKFDWTKEANARVNACENCDVNVYDGYGYLMWSCKQCGGGKAKLKRVDEAQTIMSLPEYLTGPDVEQAKRELQAHLEEQWFAKLFRLLDYDDGPCLCMHGKLFVNCNDFFAPAGDVEEVTYDELPRFLNCVHDRNSAMEWVAKKRGIPCISWREVLSKTTTRE